MRRLPVHVCYLFSKMQEKHDEIYIDKSKIISKRMSKHQCDILKIPNNNKLPQHINKCHDFRKDHLPQTRCKTI